MYPKSILLRFLWLPAFLLGFAPATVPAPPPPLRYDRRRWTINSPDPALTEAEAEKRLKALVTTVKVLGITAAAPAETRLDLLNALRQVAFGCLAAAVTYGVGRLLGVSLS